MKFLHSADWQIGTGFRQFGESGAKLRAARLRTLRRALREAEARGADAFLIAGDLFEDNQIDSRTVASVYEVLAEADQVPVFILPGNHDPFTGPASIWGRKPFSTPPRHVKVFTAPEAVAAGNGWLLASPLTQKRSTADPTAKLAELSRVVPAGEIKVGISHGSPAIESRHQADDFPIPLDAAKRLGLDYLALGHWHRPLTVDGGRTVMAGTPEQTDFSEIDAGCIHEIEIPTAGEPPRTTAVPVGEWRWRIHSHDLALPRPDDARAMQAFGLDAQSLGQTVFRIVLQGSATPRAVAEFRSWFDERLAGCGVLDFVDETSREFTAGELASLRREHPLADAVLKDLDSLASFAAGVPVPEGGIPSFTVPSFISLCDSIGCPSSEATPEFFAAARRLLLRELREVMLSC